MKKKILFIICGIIVAALLTVGVVAMLNGENNDNGDKVDADYPLKPNSTFRFEKDGTLVSEITESGKYDTPEAELTAYPLGSSLDQIMALRGIWYGDTAAYRMDDFYSFDAKFPIESACVISEDRILVTYKFTDSENEIMAYLVFGKYMTDYEGSECEVWYLTDEVYFRDEAVSDNVKNLTVGTKLMPDEMARVGINLDFLTYSDPDYENKTVYLDEAEKTQIIYDCYANGGFISDDGIIMIRLKLTQDAGELAYCTVEDVTVCPIDEKTDSIKGYPVREFEHNEVERRVIFSCKDLIE